MRRSNKTAYLRGAVQKRKEIIVMANSNRSSKKSQGLNNFKMEAAREVGVDLKDGGYNGDITSRQAGSIGGQMVKKMVEAYEKSLEN